LFSESDNADVKPDLGLHDVDFELLSGKSELGQVVKGGNVFQLGKKNEKNDCNYEFPDSISTIFF
jgi:hypothetical protein